MKPLAFGHHLSGGCFFGIAKDSFFYGTFSDSCFIMIKEGFTTFTELRKITVNDFYTLWGGAKKLGTFDGYYSD